MNKRKCSSLLPQLFAWPNKATCRSIGLGSLLFLMGNTASASCSFSIDSEWSNGYVASITIKNDTASTINSWGVSWQFSSNRMTSGWNANFSGTNPYSATNLSWNGSIAAGQSTSFGIQVDKNGGAAERPVINGAACTGTTPSTSSRSSASTSSAPRSTSSAVTTSAQTSSSSYSAPANNFAQNGGVETDLTNWGATGGTVTRTTVDKHSGNASALITSRTAAWNGITFNPGSLTNGNQYNVAVWVKLAPGTPDSVISLTAKRLDDADTSTYNEYTRVATATATASGWTLLQGYYTQLGTTAFQHFIIEATDATISYYADDFSITGEVVRTSSSSSSVTSSAPSCDLKAPLKWTSTAPVISPKNAGWVAIKDPSVVKYNDKFYVYSTYVDTGYKSMYTSFTDWGNAQQAAHISMNGSRVGNSVAPQVFYFKPHKKWYLITQWPGSYATTDDIANPNWSAKQKLLQGEPSNALDFWVICNDTHCYLYFSRDNGVLYVSKTTIANFPNFSGYSIVMEDHRGNGSNYLFEASNVYKLDGQNKYLLMVEAYMSGPRLFRSWTSSSLDGPWTPLADTETNPFAGNNNVEWPTGKWANGISHGELIRSGYDEKMTIDPCNVQFLYQGESGPGATYDTIPYKLGLLTLKK
jgi:hypothetical protein